MKYTKTSLNYNDFALLIEESLLGSSGEYVCDIQQLIELCDASLTTDSCGYPNFYYFSELDGRDYVLEENEIEDATVIYELEEADTTNSICEYILRDTLAERKNDGSNYLAHYDLPEPNYGTEPSYVIGEFCMHSNEGWSERLPVQEDMLSVIQRFLVGRHTKSHDEYEHLLNSDINTEFSTKLALSNKEKELKAIHWIERCKSLDELDGLLLPDGRNMVKVRKSEPATT